MRINQFIASNTGLSRRKADELIKNGLVTVNDTTVKLGYIVNPLDDIVKLKGVAVKNNTKHLTILFNKPKGYVVSRNGQENKTIYDILPKEYRNLKPVGRLDKESSGLLILSNDGNLIHKLSHPSNNKYKIYLVKLNKNLKTSDLKNINENGVFLEDGISKFEVTPIEKDNLEFLKIKMFEGRNRQIRRTFEKLGYRVVDLHRIKFGEISLGTLRPGELKIL